MCVCMWHRALSIEASQSPHSEAPYIAKSLSTGALQGLCKSPIAKPVCDIHPHTHISVCY